MRISTLLTNLTAAFVTAAIGGLSTGPAVQSTWHAQLRKPPYQASRMAFPILNGSWPWLVFSGRRVAAATTLNVGLTARSADLACRAIDVRGKAALPSLLYPLWCGFATVLPGYISLLNHRGG